jgi:predicted chitinase
MGQNIRDFKSWQRLNEDTSFLGWIGDLATSAFTGKAVDPAPSSVTSIAEPGSATATVIDKAASALGIKTDAKAGDKEKAKADSANTSTKFKKFDKKIPAENVSALEAAMERHGITNDFARKAILGVISKESSNLTPEGDYSNTSNSRIREVYGVRVEDLSDSELTALKENPTKFWDRVYGVDDPTGRGVKYGNTQPGDGARYRGRGFNQLTFKSNYKKLQEVFDKMGKLNAGTEINIVEEPELLEDPSIAAEFAILYFINSFKGKGKDLNGYTNLESAVTDYVQANAGWGTDIRSGHTARGFERALDYASSIA